MSQILLVKGNEDNVPVYTKEGIVLSVKLVGNIGGGDTDQELVVDEITGVLATIDVVHHEVHEGEYFHAEYAASVNNNASLDLAITTGSEGMHFTAMIDAGGACQVYLYEDPTVSSGTAVDTNNMKRSDTTHVSPFSVVRGPTVTSVGTKPLINGRYIAGGNSQQTRIGGGVRTGTEWILKASSKYLLRVTNISGSAVIISAAVEGYEA